MTIKIPDYFMGKPIKGSIEKGLAKVGKQPVQPTQIAQTVTTQANINPSDYIQVPQHNIVIARAETLKGLNFYDTLENLVKTGLKAPKVREFMTHYLNVRDAFEGKATLYDAAGNSLVKNEIEDLWKYLSSGHRNGCYTWLDAFFRKNKRGNLEMETELKVNVNGKDKSLQGTSLGEIGCLTKDCFAALDSLNPEGLPAREFTTQKYSQGQNIYFYYPRENRVAGFFAYSSGAGLSCGGDPTDSDASLGVFACAEGATAQKT